MRKVYIPENVTYLGEEAFHGFNWMEYLVIHHDPEYVKKEARWMRTVKCRDCSGNISENKKL